MDDLFLPLQHRFNLSKLCFPTLMQEQKAVICRLWTKRTGRMYSEWAKLRFSLNQKDGEKKNAAENVELAVRAQLSLLLFYKAVWNRQKESVFFVYVGPATQGYQETCLCVWERKCVWLNSADTQRNTALMLANGVLSLCPKAEPSGNMREDQGQWDWIENLQTRSRFPAPLLHISPSPLADFFSLVFLSCCDSAAAQKIHSVSPLSFFAKPTSIKYSIKTLQVLIEPLEVFL